MSTGKYLPTGVTNVVPHHGVVFFLVPINIGIADLANTA